MCRKFGLVGSLIVGLGVTGLAAPVLVPHAYAVGVNACNGNPVNVGLGGPQNFNVAAGDEIIVTVTVTAVTANPTYSISFESAGATALSFTGTGSQTASTTITAADSIYAVFVSLTTGAATASITATCIAGGTTASASSPIEARMDSLFSVEPDRNRLRRRLSGNTEDSAQPLNFSLLGGSSQISSRFSAALSQVSAYSANEAVTANDPFNAVRRERQRADIWVEAYLRRYWSDAASADREGTLGIVYGGIDYTLTDDILIGFLAQVDWAEESIGATNTQLDGVGWMAGPYATVQLTDDIFFDMRASWGTSSNDQSVAGVTGSFDTTRWVVAAQLSGDWHHEDWRITPIASLRYGSETTESFVNSAGTTIAGATATSGQASLGPEIGYTYTTERGTSVEPFFALHGLWDFAGNDMITVGAVTANLDDIRAEAELGLSTRWAGGAALRASLAYDGLGTSDLDAISGRLWLNIPLD